MRQLSDFLLDFVCDDVTLKNGITLHYALGGTPSEKTPLLLVHGHPHTHVIWRKVVQTLGKDRLVLCPDLRGYGDSSKPASRKPHRAYSKKAMSEDLVLLLDALNFRRVHYVGHDRGGRVGHRFCLEYPDRVATATFIDIAPTATMYAKTDMEFARRYFWWFFLIQPEPFPEKLIGTDPEWFLRRHIAGQLKIAGSCEESAITEYLRCYRNPATIHAICEDYRAAATCDLEDDHADCFRQIEAPLLLLWGALGTVGELYDVPATWREKAIRVSGEALPCGHSPEEECPELFCEKLLAFIRKYE